MIQVQAKSLDLVLWKKKKNIERTLYLFWKFDTLFEIFVLHLEVLHLSQISSLVWFCVYFPYY